VTAIRILIVDDHPVVRDGLRGMFSGDPDFDVVGEASDGAETIELASQLGPDVILMDLRMPLMSGAAAIRVLTERSGKGGQIFGRVGASAADATGPAGWMIVRRWVSSKSNVCEVIPLTSAALPMSTDSRRPSTLACAAGSSSATAASAASAAAWRDAPIAHPSQL